MNSKVLTKALNDYRFNLLKGGVFDSKGIGKFLKDEAVKSSDPFINFLGNLDDTCCFEFYSYWVFKDKIQEYQIVNNISSIYFEEANWDGFVFRYPQKAFELIELPQDRKILRKYKDKIIDFFIEFSKTKFLKNYQLYLENYDDPYSIDVNYIPQNVQDIQNIRHRFDCASLSFRTPQSSPVYEMEGSNKKIAYWKRSFTLYLTKGDLEHPSEMMNFELFKAWDYEPPISEI